MLFPGRSGGAVFYSSLKIIHTNSVFGHESTLKVPKDLANENASGLVTTFMPSSYGAAELNLNVQLHL